MGRKHPWLSKPHPLLKSAISHVAIISWVPTFDPWESVYLHSQTAHKSPAVKGHGPEEMVVIILLIQTCNK